MADIAKHYKEQYEWMKAMRRKGHTGRLEFSSFAIVNGVVED